MQARCLRTLLPLAAPLLALQAPGLAQPQSTQPRATDCLDYLGYLEFTRRRNIRFTYYPPINRTITIRRSDKAYAAYVAILGDVAPGERKYLLKLDGTVRMNPDRTLDIRWDPSARRKSRIELLQPNDQAYHSLLERVNGLQPGQEKGIPTLANRCRTLAAPAAD